MLKLSSEQAQAQCSNWCEITAWGWSRVFHSCWGKQEPSFFDNIKCTQQHSSQHAKSLAVHARSTRDETEQDMLCHPLIGWKGWDPNARDQTVGLPSYQFSHATHICKFFLNSLGEKTYTYESSFGFSKWKKMKYVFKGFNLIFSGCYTHMPAQGPKLNGRLQSEHWRLATVIICSI